MTDTHVELIQTSFSKVRTIADAAASLFYERLFTLAPELRPLFPDDMTEQKKKLMMMLGMIVASLKDPETMRTMLLSLGQRHMSYGVTTEQFGIVGASLIWTLEQGLGKDFTPETRTAWLAAYHAIATTMSEAMVEA
jgi:hemoglobin-like flavoprotein